MTATATATATAAAEVTIPYLLADYIYTDIEPIAENSEGEYSAEDAEAALALRDALDSAVIARKAAKVVLTPAMQAMMLEGWSGTDVLDSVWNKAHNAWEPEEGRQVKRQITMFRKKLAGNA